jgi:predicted alpha/beta hydrolase
VIEETVRVRASDGLELAATLLVPEARAASVVVAPAMGVKRGYYEPFARALAARGMETLVFDWRGIGGSRPERLRGFPATYRDWGERDLDAAIRFLAERAGGRVLLVGHSAGGQLAGLAAAIDRVAAMIFVASTHGHWTNWHGAWRARVLLLWFGVVPVVARVLGRFPLWLLGGSGEDIPRGVALDWARWCRHPRYVRSYADAAGIAGYDRFAGPLRAYSIADDDFAPRAGVEHMVALYPNARAELRAIAPADLGVARIGHFGFFRETFAATLWKEAADWLFLASDGTVRGSRPASDR